MKESEKNIQKTILPPPARLRPGKGADFKDWLKALTKKELSGFQSWLIDLKEKARKDATVEVDTIREEMPPDLKKKLFPDDEPTDPVKVRQNASTASKKEGYGEP